MGIEVLRGKTREWDGDIVQVAFEEFHELFGYTKFGLHHPPKPGYDKAPFRGYLGVHHKTRRVFYACNEDDLIGPLIHEMGHVFASRFTPKDWRCNEFNFFGWEYALARQLNLVTEWETGNKFYRVSREHLYSELAPEKREALLKGRLKVARKRGLITSDDMPVNIR